MGTPEKITSEDSAVGYSISVQSEEHPELQVSVDVELPDDVEPDDIQRAVVEEYAGNIETFIRKNVDYGSSFSTGPKIESLLKYGEVREEELPRLIAKQIFVRGFLDKMSRFYSLYIDDNEKMVDESVMDTLLDLGNYSHMLAALLRKYENEAGDDD